MSFHYFNFYFILFFIFFFFGGGFFFFIFVMSMYIVCILCLPMLFVSGFKYITVIMMIRKHDASLNLFRFGNFVMDWKCNQH